MTLPSVLATCPIRASNPASFASYVAPPSIGPRPTSAEHLIRKAAVASHLCAPALPQTAAPVDPRPPAPSSLDRDRHLRRVAHAACFGPYSHRSPTRDCAGNEYFATTRFTSTRTTMWPRPEQASAATWPSTTTSAPIRLSATRRRRPSTGRIEKGEPPDERPGPYRADTRFGSRRGSRRLACSSRGAFGHPSPEPMEDRPPVATCCQWMHKHLAVDICILHRRATRRLHL